MKSPFGRIFEEQNIDQDKMNYKLSNDYVNVSIQDKHQRIYTGTVVKTLNAFARTVQDQTTEKLGLIQIEGDAEMLFLSTYPLEFEKKQLLYEQLFSNLKEHTESESVQEKLFGISKIIATIVGDEMISLYVDIVDDDEVREYFSDSDRYEIANVEENRVMLTRELTDTEQQLFKQKSIFETVPEHIPVSSNSNTEGLGVTVYFDSDEETVKINRSVQQELTGLSHSKPL